MRPGLPALLALGCLLAPACGIKTTAHLVAAERAVHRAEDRGAPANAAYEYTLAVRYLEKAREEAAHARHGDAIDLARKAEGYADQSVIVMQEKGLGALEGETAVTLPAPAPAPAEDAAPTPAPTPEDAAPMPAPTTTPDPAPAPEPPTYTIGDPVPEPEGGRP